MIRRPIKRATALWLGLVSIAVMLAAYTVLSHWQHLKNPTDTTIPTWGQLGRGVVSAFELNARSQDRWVVEDAKATGMRLFLGLFLGGAGAVVLGLAMGCLAVFESFFYPPLSLLAKI